MVNDANISAKHLEVKLCEPAMDSIKVTNFGCSISSHDGSRIHRHQSVELKLPALVYIGSTHVQIFDAAKPCLLDSAIEEVDFKNEGSISRNPSGTSPAPLTLEAWFEALSQLQRSIAGSPEFFDEAARAIHTPGGLDGGMVLTPDDEGWTVAASFIPSPEFGTSFRADLADRVLKSGKSVFHSASRARNQKENTGGSDSCILIPVFDLDDEVVSIIYGFRSQHRQNNRIGIRAMEAQFLRLIADSVSVSLARMNKEANAARNQVLLEQAFSPKVARQLESNTEILNGQTREVTVLFADMRDFTTISEKIGTHQTYLLLTEVMDEFCNIIHNRDGVIIDFYGDGVSAFWNAPIDQPDHATLACQAAMEIAKCTEHLSVNWRARLGQSLRVGIGVNTGSAQVGNSGSSRRLKYGPRGSAINIASRLESSTKQVGIPVIVSEKTAQSVKDHFHSRRICTTTLKGLKQPISLFELADIDGDDSFIEEWQEYDVALELIEACKFTDAIQLLTDLQISNGTDPVSEFLLNRAMILHNPIADTTTQNYNVPPVVPITSRETASTEPINPDELTTPKDKVVSQESHE